jgi:hypothetical protein
LIIGIILMILWLLGWFVSKILGGLIHIALVIAVAPVNIWLMRSGFKLFQQFQGRAIL